MRKFIYLGPLVFFIVTTVYFALPIIQGKDPRILPSTMIEKNIPDLNLPPLLETKPGINKQALIGEIQLVNFFSSWCGPCRTEHDFLMRIRESKTIPLFGSNYKDKQKAAKTWLLDLGDPYERIGRDVDGRTAIDWGVYGVPETYLIDKHGRIQYRHVGPLSESVFKEKISPVIEALRKQSNG